MDRYELGIKSARSGIHSSNSDSTYELSDDDFQGSNKPRRGPFMWDAIGRRDVHEPDAEARSLMESNHLAYLHRKASPYEWQDVLANLHVFGPQEWLSEKVICRNLMDLWWPLRHDPGTRCTYLPFSILHELSSNISKQGDGLENLMGFEDGPFHSQYSSIVPQLSHRLVGFVLIRNLGAMQDVNCSGKQAFTNPNHFFAVIFDYDSQQAYSFGALGGQQTDIQSQEAATSGWDKWYGPELWKALARYLGWEDLSTSTRNVRVISKDWKQVRDSAPPHMSAIDDYWNVSRMAMIVAHTQLLSCQCT